MSDQMRKGVRQTVNRWGFTQGGTGRRYTSNYYVDPVVLKHEIEEGKKTVARVKKKSGGGVGVKMIHPFK